MVCWCFLSFACFAFTTKTKRFASVEEFYFFPLTGSDDEYLPIHRQDNNMIINKKVACIKEDSGVKFLLLGLPNTTHKKQKNVRMMSCTIYSLWSWKEEFPLLVDAVVVVVLL